MAGYRTLAVQGIISLPYRASQIFIVGPIGPAVITILVKIVLTLLKSFENLGQYNIDVFNMYEMKGNIFL